MAQLEIGDKAPDFVLPGDGGTNVKLSALKGRKVVKVVKGVKVIKAIKEILEIKVLKVLQVHLLMQV